MALWRLYYHLIWATRDRDPLIGTDIEQELYGYIIGKSNALESITHAIGGVQDHIHLVVSIPPKLSIADFVKGIKGSSAHHLNHGMDSPMANFGWQRGYGVFSLGGKQLAQAVNYVRNQKQHHRQGTTIATLEEDHHHLDDAPASWNKGAAIGDIRRNLG